MCTVCIIAQSWNHKEPEINGGFPKQPFVVQALCHSETANVFLVVGANRPRSTASEATLRQSMGPMGLYPPSVAILNGDSHDLNHPRP